MASPLRRTVGRAAAWSRAGSAQRKTAKPSMFATSPQRIIQPRASGATMSALQRVTPRYVARCAAPVTIARAVAATTHLQAQSVGMTNDSG